MPENTTTTTTTTTSTTATAKSDPKEPPSSQPGARRKRKRPGSAQPGRTIGPVSDLERHLPSDWWRTLFNAIYLKTDGDVVEHDGNTVRDVDLLVRAVGIEPNDRILDLCCGQGRHCIELARRGFKHVVGVDRSRYLIRLAKKRAKQAGLSVAFHEGDARRFRLPEASFNCVALLGNSFGYFDREEDDLRVLKAALRVLRPRGGLVLDLSDGQWVREHFDRRSWEWIDENHFVCRERSLDGDGARLITREVVVHSERGVIADQFYAERLYASEQIRGLLERAGYTDIRLHEMVPSLSTRNQDLGMMAQRILMTAQAPPKPIEAPKRRSLFREVTVVLGDPRLPDLVKRGGKFNEEDYQTVDRLKRALAELSEYAFGYLDNHAALMTELRLDPPEFVLNLCDEGYNNDAFMEPHVPAVLDMLGIPYTGAGPSCLSLCFNKALVRAIAQSLDIPVPAETYFDPADQAATLPAAFPALVKPNFGDSSVGITMDAVVSCPEELVAYLDRLRDQWPGRPVLVQEFLTGAEYSVAVIGNPGLSFRVLPILKVDYSGLDSNLPRILGYESKWIPGSPYWTQIKYQEADDIDEDTQRQLADHSQLLFERLGCRDYARFDFRADEDGVIKLLEANPNPGWCWDGKFNLMAEFGGLRYAELLRMIIEVAQERIAASGRVPAAATNGHGPLFRNGHAAATVVAPAAR